MKKHHKRKHSSFSASASKRWLTCPGSVALSRQAPPQKESFYAKEGTEAHECLEFIVKRYGNKERAVGEALKRWPLEMVEHCEKSADLVFELKPSEHAKLLVETRVQISSISDKLFGTLDYAWIEDWGKLVIIDFKYGAGIPVLPFEDGEENTQLLYYAAGLCDKFGYDFETIELAVIQPRVWRDDGSALTSHETSVSVVKDFKNKIRDAISVAKKPNAPLCAGDHCRFCPASPLCPELSKNSMAAADIVFDVDDGKIQALPQTELIPVAKLPQVLKSCDLLEKWIKSVREFAFEYAEAGNEIEGYKLVAKRSTRSWLPEAEDAARRLFKNEAYEETKRFLSPAQLEKKLGAKAKAFTEEYTTAISSGFTLVPEKDKRAPVKDVVVFDTL